MPESVRRKPRAYPDVRLGPLAETYSAIALVSSARYLSGLYAFLTVVLLVTPGTGRVPGVVVSGMTTAVFAGVNQLRRGPLHRVRAVDAAGLLGVVGIANVAAGPFLSSRPELVVQMPLAIGGVALLVLSRTWLLTTTTLGVASFAATWAAMPDDAPWPVYSYAMVSACALASITRITLVRALRSTERARLELALLATRDELTGTRNRLGFFQDAERLLQTVDIAGLPLLLASVDVDRLKQINDTHGHAAGDAAIHAAAAALLRAAGGEGTVGRIGGDELVLVLPGRTDASALGRSVLAEVARAEALPVQPLKVSVGVVIREAGSGENIDSLLLRADAEMYVMKTSARSARTS